MLKLMRSRAKKLLALAGLELLKVTVKQRLLVKLTVHEGRECELNIAGLNFFDASAQSVGLFMAATPDEILLGFHSIKFS